MKKFSKVLFLLVFSAITVSSQAQLAVGLKAGLNFANVSARQDGFSTSLGRVSVVNVGAVIEIGVSEKFAIQPEVAFLQKGFKLDLTDFGFGNLGTTTQKFNYLEITPLAKYKFGGEKIGAYVAVGPSFGYALSGTFENTDTGEKQNINFEEDPVNRLDVGFAFGGGINLKRGSVSPFLDLRYLLGFTNLAGEDAGFENGSINNRGILLTFGVLFSL